MKGNCHNRSVITRGTTKVCIEITKALSNEASSKPPSDHVHTRHLCTNKLYQAACFGG